jgi:hypothetical protein
MFVRAFALLLIVVSSAGVAMSPPASASTPETVGLVPSSSTPYLPRHPVNQTIEELEPCGGVMYAVGSMTAVRRGSVTYARSNAFSFSATTGAMTGWKPRVNGAVRSIALSPDCSTAYLGGTFTRVNGVATGHLVAVDAVTGETRRRFRGWANGSVETVRFAHQQVIIGGSFAVVNGERRNLMASLSPTTGAVTRYLDERIAGAYPRTASGVYGAQLSHAGDRLLIEGVFTSINGSPRQQAAVLDLGRKRAHLDPWRSAELLQTCKLHWYVRAGNWSPDDRTIYLASTGLMPESGRGSSRKGPRAGLCDSVASFPASPGPVSHRWINYAGCDSYYSVAADSHNVYVSGHARWANNRNGCDAAGPGAVSRPGIASINPRTGRVTRWNPTRSRGVGSHQLVLTRAGLWIASDTWRNGSAQYCGGVSHHGGLCFLPY